MDHKSLKPLKDNVVVKRMNPEEKTPGGLYIPQDAQEKPNMGKVIAVGPGSIGNNGDLIPCSVSKGDSVLFGQWSGTDLGDDYLIIKDSDILCKQ